MPPSSTRPRRRAALCLGASLVAIATLDAAPARALVAQSLPAATPTEKPAPQPKVLKTGVPKGFEDIDDAVTTDFDVTYLGHPVGAFTATFKDGVLHFAHPEAVAAALGSDVDTAAVVRLLSQGLAANEQYRCRPGQSPNVGCGLLPAGTVGAIVSIESFDVSLFLTRDYLVSAVRAPRMLGAPMSGPSLIQGVQFSAASLGGGGVTYGGTFDTLASVGRTAFIAQSTLSSGDGLRAQQMFAQRIWSDRRAAVGLIQDADSLTLNTYRVRGAEFGSYYGTLLDNENDTATPLEIVLPKRAQVEIYRNGVLVASGQYEGGLQLLDTHALPTGSYPVRIVARDGGQILLDQTRSFSKLGNLVPPGKTAFRVRVGERVRDTFALTDDGSTAAGGLLPRGTGEFVASALAQRRIGRSAAAGISLATFNGRAYGEAQLQLFRGSLSGMVAVGGGSNGAYSALVSGTLQLRRISFNLSARTVHSDSATVDETALADRYYPFLSRQDTIFGSVQWQALGGSLSLSGSYTRTQRLSDRYAAGVQYSRSVALPLIGTALLAANASVTDLDKRVGLSLSFFRTVDRKTNASFTAGGEYVADPKDGAGRAGFSPVAEATLTRAERIGSADIVGQAGATTDADTDRAYAQLRTQSPYGSADATVQYQTRDVGGTNMSYLANVQTGFAITGGAVKLGLRNPASSIVLLDLRDVKSPRGAGAQADPSATSGDDGAHDADRAMASGGYRITIDGRPADFIEPGSRTAVGLNALREYDLGLRPEGAPQFDLNATSRHVALYPGNVVRLRFEAQRVVSLFGQVLTRAGKPLPNARVAAGNDFAVADDHGFFTITAPISAKLDIKDPHGEACAEPRIDTLVRAGDPVLLYRIGEVRCDR